MIKKERPEKYMETVGYCCPNCSEPIKFIRLVNDFAVYFCDNCLSQIFVKTKKILCDEQKVVKKCVANAADA